MPVLHGMEIEAHRRCHSWLERRAASWDLLTEITSLELHVADTTIVARVWAECPVHGWRVPDTRRRRSNWGAQGWRNGYVGLV